MSEIPKWQVHRGYWMGGLRENTMQSFYAAKRLGAEMIEFDVRLSRDGVPVIFHDESLKRIFHVDQKVSKMTWDELSSLSISRLLDVIKNPNVPIYLNVELKSESLFPFRLCRKVVEVLASVKGKKYLVSSFNPFCLYLSKFIAPTLPRGLILGDEKMILSWRLKWAMKLSEPKYIHLSEALLEKEETRNAIIALGLPVVVWTVNDGKKAEFFLERGAISIISDNPPPPHLRRSGGAL